MGIIGDLTKCASFSICCYYTYKILGFYRLCVMTSRLRKMRSINFESLLPWRLPIKDKSQITMWNRNNRTSLFFQGNNVRKTLRFYFHCYFVVVCLSDFATSCSFLTFSKESRCNFPGKLFCSLKSILKRSFHRKCYFYVLLFFLSERKSPSSIVRDFGRDIRFNLLRLL